MRVKDVEAARLRGSRGKFASSGEWSEQFWIFRNAPCRIEARGETKQEREGEGESDRKISLVADYQTSGSFNDGSSSSSKGYGKRKRMTMMPAS